MSNSLHYTLYHTPIQKKKFDNQVDRYTYTPTASGTYNIHFSGVNNWIELDVVDPIGKMLVHKTGTKFEADLEAGKTYSVVVRDYNGAMGQYKLGFELID